ncbi:MAG: hypothetical protein V4469_02315 [Patescibacteria group bacterium]
MKKEQYLPEDKDILDALDSIGEISTGIAFSKQQMKMNELQIKATLRTNKTMVDLDASNKKFSKVIAFFAIVQMIIAIFQFALDVSTSTEKGIAISIGVAFIIMMVIMFRTADKEFK